MHSYLITSQSNGESKKEAQKLAQKLSAQLVPFELAKIEDVRELAHFTKLSLSKKTVVFLENFDKASEQAQNALLKALEEPQENLFYILSTQNKGAILPTIISRCQVIEVMGQKELLPEAESLKVESFLEASVGEKLAAISKLQKKEEALEFMENLLVFGQKKLPQEPELAFFLECALGTLQALRKNGNVQLQLTNFVVSLNLR